MTGSSRPSSRDAFSYLSEQNVVLARRAARGVMSVFAGDVAGERLMPGDAGPQRVLPAA